jgi:hypothetical protein
VVRRARRTVHVRFAALNEPEGSSVCWMATPSQLALMLRLGVAEHGKVRTRWLGASRQYPAFSRFNLKPGLSGVS